MLVIKKISDTFSEKIKKYDEIDENIWKEISYIKMSFFLLNEDSK